MVLQFENMVMGWESRPRSGSHKFHVALGAMFLRDQLTEDTAFPVLVGPQSREPTPLLGRSATAARGFRFISPGDKCEEPLFKLAYEYRPFHSSKEYKLHVVTRSLEVVYNPEAVKWLSDFFTRPHQTSDAQLRQAARHRYEAMKLRTKLELMRNWDHILEGGL
ncbi:unnamed protein product, partial [Timema podura]|nr:unnamed protein product [Timema podura]